jgi:hypothetical protein
MRVIGGKGHIAVGEREPRLLDDVRRGVGSGGNGLARYRQCHLCRLHPMD